MQRYPDNGYKFILTGIDYFTKFAFARAIRNKEPETVWDALMDICEENKTYPVILQSDNGSEFKNNYWKERILELQDDAIIFQQVFTTTYTPTGNALIENLNGQLWRMIHDVFVRSGSKLWVNDLQHIINSKNNRIHSVTKRAPSSIWQPDIHENIQTNNQLMDVRDKLIKKAKRDVKANDKQELKKYDLVRVAATSLSSKLRKVTKAGIGKLIPVKWTPKVYLIHKVKRPRGEQKDMRKFTYILQELKREPNEDGNGTRLQWVNVITEHRGNDAHNRIRQEQRFFATELQKVGSTNKKNKDPLTLQDLKKYELISKDQMNNINAEAVEYYDEEEKQIKEKIKRTETIKEPQINLENPNTKRELKKLNENRTDKILVPAREKRGRIPNMNNI